MKRRIYIVPHTHWDREWIFSEQTGNVLLNKFIHEMMSEINKNNEYKLLLDGQASLIDDFIKWSPNKKRKLVNLLKKGAVSLGPWYSQPDVFSSLGETTIRNIEVGKKTIKDLGIEPMNTAYMPDTFGFNQNLPQIFVKNGLKNFVHWRGLTPSQLKSGNAYIWRGIDGTKINSLNYKLGYHCAVSAFPYNNLTEDNFKDKLQNFNSEIDRVVSSISEDENKPLLIPLGWDQVPVTKRLAEFIKKAEVQQTKYTYIIKNNFEDYFKEYESIFKKEFSGDLKTATTGRVHSTISSNRYDIKRLFRKCEIALYYKLEPLEILFKKIDNSYSFDEFKLNRITKPLLKLQAHDSLGACNNDVTNQDILAKLKQIYRRIISQIDLITYNLLQLKGHKKSENGLMLINQLPFKRDIFKVMTIYSNKKYVAHNNGDIEIKTISSKNVAHPFKVMKMKAFELNVLVIGRDMKPWEVRDINLNKISNTKNEHPPKLEEKWCKKIKINSFPSFFLSLEKGEGDAYDYSPIEEIKVIQKYKLITRIKTKDYEYREYKAKISFYKKTQDLTILTTISKETIDFKIKLSKNSLTSHRLLINFNVNGDVYKTHHLAYSKFVDIDQTKNWKKNLKEFPVINDYNDGLIHFKKENISILTKGNNEFQVKNGVVSIVLMRTNKWVSEADTKWRPGRTSGFTTKEETIDSRLLNKTNFLIRVSKTKSYQESLNNWNFEPIIAYKNNVHLNAHACNKFVINDIENLKDYFFKKFPKEIYTKTLISKLRLNNQNHEVRLSNISDKKISFKLGNKELKFKQNEYKDLNKLEI